MSDTFWKARCGKTTVVEAQGDTETEALEALVAKKPRGRQVSMTRWTRGENGMATFTFGDPSYRLPRTGIPERIAELKAKS